jgi:hypothetical protein
VEAGDDNEGNNDDEQTEEKEVSNSATDQLSSLLNERKLKETMISK